jgi:hypothetical protein
VVSRRRFVTVPLCIFRIAAENFNRWFLRNIYVRMIAMLISRQHYARAHTLSVNRKLL